MEQKRPGSIQPRAYLWGSAAIVAAATGLRGWLACYDHSVFWPDEIHQSLEQAHRAVFGYGLVPWEFRDGARSWLFPGAIAGMWKVASTLGVDSSIGLITLARLSMVAASIVSIWFAAKLAAIAGGKRAGMAAAIVLATFPPAVVFSYRAMSETASAPLIVLSAWFVCKRTPRTAMLAGLAIGVACLLRYQNGLFAIVFALALLLQRRWREAIAFCGLGALVALLGGILDWVTWGQPFHSLVAYVKFNLLLGGASTFGVEPFSFYLTSLWSSVGPLLPLLVAFFCVGAYYEPVLSGSVVAYVLAHCVLPHKEFRFLVPCFPLFASVAAIGFERVLRRLPAPRVASVLSAVGLTAAFGYGLIHLTYQDMGQYNGTERASTSVWKSEEEPTLLLAEAGERADLCGIAVLGARAAFTGGYTYLHRDVPLIYEGELCSTAPANYAIGLVSLGPSTLPGSYKLQRQLGHWGLYRREGSCQSKQDRDDRLLEGARDMGLARRQALQGSDGAVRFDLLRDAGAFTAGWGHGELLDCDAARWVTGKHAFVDFEFNPTGPQYQLNMHARAHEWTTPQRFAVAVNGHRIHLGPMPSQLKTYAMDIPDHALRAGRNRIELAFRQAARASANDERELSALFRSIELVPKHDDFTIDVALAESHPHLIHGFSPSEQADNVTFAWNDGPVSEIEGTLAWPHSPYVLQTVAEAVPLVASQRTRVIVNGHSIGTISFQRKWAAQRLVVPASVLSKGKNRIRFEYEATARPAVINKKLPDHRELAVRFRRIELSPLTAGTALDFGTEQARPFLIEGWSADERDGERTVVWSNGSRASVVLSLKGIARPVVHLTAHGYSRALPINVTVSLNGNVVGAFAAPDGWQDIAVPMPAAAYSAAGEILTFDFDRTARPSDANQQSRDSRELALRIDGIRVTPDADGAIINASVRALRSDESNVAARSLDAP